MRACQIPHLVRIPNNDCKRGLCCLFHAHARLDLSLGRRCGRRLDWRWRPRSRCGSIRVVVVVQIHRVHHPGKGRGRGTGCLARISAGGLLLRGRWRSFGRRWCCSAQGTERVLNRFEFRGLAAILPSSWAASYGRARCGGDIGDGACGRFRVALNFWG